MEIVFKAPDDNAPGFLKRSRQLISVAQKLTHAMNPEVIDEVVEFLLPFIAVPEDRTAAREALWNASKTEFESYLKQLGGGGTSTVPPTLSKD